MEVAMKKSFFINNSIVFAAFIILVIFATCASPYYTSNMFNNNFRTKKTEEYQNQTTNHTGYVHSLDSDTSFAQETVYMHSPLEDILLFLINNKLTLFLILTVLFAFNQLYRFIKRRNILISQTKTKGLIVHYLQQKDGKKDALSLAYSF
jgi:hypothetical protein